MLKSLLVPSEVILLTSDKNNKLAVLLADFGDRLPH